MQAAQTLRPPGALPPRGRGKTRAAPAPSPGLCPCRASAFFESGGTLGNGLFLCSLWLSFPIAVCCAATARYQQFFINYKIICFFRGFVYPQIKKNAAEGGISPDIPKKIKRAAVKGNGCPPRVLLNCLFFVQLLYVYAKAYAKTNAYTQTMGSTPPPKQTQKLRQTAAKKPPKGGTGTWLRGHRFCRHLAGANHIPPVCG